MRFLSFLIFSALLIPSHFVLASAQAGSCTGNISNASRTVSSTEAGVFMSGLCRECWELGDCSLNDILSVVANAGNFILSIVASLVFLIYILGGFWWIASHGNSAWVEKGKKWIKNATLGLFIVLIAYTGVVALRLAITKGELASSYVLCSGDETSGKACGFNSLCYGFSCMSSCESGGGSCLDATAKATVEADGDGVCSQGTLSCPDASLYCCTPVTPTTSP